MQIFNRDTKPLTLCSNKSAVKTELLHAKDETVILSDRSIIDDDKKRTEMLQHILTENDSMDCQPHNLAIFSTHAQYLLPPEKKICLTLPENFAPAMTKEEEAEMCDDLNYLINTIASYICKTTNCFEIGSNKTLSISSTLNSSNTVPISKAKAKKSLRLVHYWIPFTFA